MNSPSRASLKLARTLLALEAAPATPSGGKGRIAQAANPGERASRVCAKINKMLTAFAGSMGCRSLLARSLTLAQVRDDLLAPVQVLENGTFSGLESITAESDARAEAACETLLTQFLDLLVILIGEPLTLQLVRSAWPNLSADTLPSKTEDSL